ncbi:MAG: cupin domain-containing protein [Pseudomonadota bacterium]
MEIFKNGSRPTRRPDPAYFTGDVWMDPIVEAPAPARVRALRVSFQPGARTNWHTHPLGQTLYVLSGTGRYQTDGEPVRTLAAGDTVWIPPGEKHWHGAAPDTAMVHVAIQEADESGNVTWLEPVSEEDYSRPPQDPA